MSEKDLLKLYVQEVNKLKARAKDSNLSDSEIDRIIESCFEDLGPQKHSRKTWIKVLVFVLGALLSCYVLLYVHQPTSSLVLRNVQGLIYPGLKFVRFLSMPIIKHYPSLTELYDESCLVENPYFYVNNMECWPCENVYSVINITDHKNKTVYEFGAPFITKLYQQPLVYFKDIQTIYSNNRETFNKDASKIKSNHNLSNIKDILDFEISESSDVHISWRINRMLPARTLRPLFPRPYIFSEWSGQSIERFVMIDGPKGNGHSLPNFECSYVYMIQGSGERTIVLRPSQECGNRCRSVSVVLKQSHVLWYNWWYWRPISLPVENSTNISISYISSYC